MPEYAKPWLSLDEQVDKLESRGVDIGSASSAKLILQQVGYYRLTGYLYSFRDSEIYADDSGRERIRVLGNYRPGTSIAYAARLIDYDRELRMLVLDAVERIEVSLRMQIGYTCAMSPRTTLAYSIESLSLRPADLVAVRSPR